MSAADENARLRIRAELDRTMVVVAGAGTGKTTELVERVVNMVGSGVARFREIAAITFTEAAAAELRERIRSALVRVSEERPDDPLIQSALDEVDEAAISTLHSFAQTMLLEHCAAAGLPSGFEVLDDTADAVDFDERWTRFADRLLDDPEAEPALVRGFTTGLRHTDLRTVAKALHDNWDRLEDSGAAAAAGTRENVGASVSSWPAVDPSLIVRHLGRAQALTSCCHEDSDNLLAHLRLVVADATAQLLAAGDDEEAVLSLLASLPPLRCNLGRQENWGGRIDEVREACAAAEAERSEILSSVRLAVLRDLLPRLVTFVLDAASERRSEGRLTFHDLLVHARRLLRNGGEAVEALRERYRWILVDEFQDTDPIQVELAARLACESGRGDDLTSSRPGGLFVVGDPKQSIYRFRRADIDLFDRVGTEIGERIVLLTNFRSVPGILDFVNVVFEDLFGSAPVPGQACHHALEGERIPLPDDLSATAGGTSSNTPSRGGIGRRAGQKEPPRRTVQLSFEHLGSESKLDEDLAPAVATNATAESSSPRSGPIGPGTSPRRPPVVVVGEQIEASVPEIRRRAASDAAACIRRIVDERWPVGDAEGGHARAPRFADIAVLIPTRTSLASLEEAFEEADVPYRVEGASMLWGTEDVDDVLSVLRAVDDPADELSLLTALRSPGLGCGDDDLVSWQAGGGRWDLRAPAPEGLGDHPVTRSIAVLARLHAARWWTCPSEMVSRTVEELRSFALACAHRRPRDHWQRIRWLCDQARLFDETAGGSLRSFLDWAHVQAEGDAGVRGVGPPDPDDDAVRVMTVHGAKGLEFPVVVLAGLERQDSDGHQTPAVLWTEEGSIEVRAGPNFRTDGYDEAGARDQELDNLERRRLLYVAMTRARDHLVLCVHRRAKNGAPDSSLASRLVGICDQHRDLCRRLDLDENRLRPPGPSVRNLPAQSVRTLGAGASGGSRTTGSSDAGAGAHESRESLADEWSSFCGSWETSRRELVRKLRRQPVTSATALAEDLLSARDGPAAAPSHEARRREPGTALRIGRAVHNVLSGVDLATGLDGSGRTVDELARSAASSHAVPACAASIASMARRALRATAVGRAATRRHWKEMYVGVPVALDPAQSDRQGVVEGFADLVFEDDDGLVVVDYKTDEITGDQVEEHFVRYGAQLGAYAMAIESSCGRPVRRCVLVFLGSPTTTERSLEGPELERARARARELASAALNV